MADDKIYFDVDELEDMAYRDIQALCKKLGYRANQKKAVLVDLLRDYHAANFGQVEEEEENQPNGEEEEEQVQPAVENQPPAKEDEEEEEVPIEKPKPKRVAKRRNRAQPAPSEEMREVVEPAPQEEQHYYKQEEPAADEEVDHATEELPAENSFAEMVQDEVSGEEVYAEEDEEDVPQDMIEPDEDDDSQQTSYHSAVSLDDHEVEDEENELVEAANHHAAEEEAEEVEGAEDEVQDVPEGSNAMEVEAQEGPMECYQQEFHEPELESEEDEEVEEEDEVDDECAEQAEETHSTMQDYVPQVQEAVEDTLEDEALPVHDTECDLEEDQTTNDAEEVAPTTSTPASIKAVPSTPTSTAASVRAQIAVSVSKSATRQSAVAQTAAKRRMSVAVPSVARPTQSSLRRSMASSIPTPAAKKTPAPVVKPSVTARVAVAPSTKPPAPRSTITSTSASGRRASMMAPASAVKSLPAANASTRRVSMAPALISSKPAAPVRVPSVASKPITSRPTTSRPQPTLTVASAPRQATPMPASKRPASGPSVSSRALAQPSSAPQKPKRVDFDAAHAKEFSKKEDLVAYTARMKQRLEQSRQASAAAASRTRTSSTSTSSSSTSDLGVSKLLQKKRKDREESEKENAVAENGAVIRMEKDLPLPAIKRARASFNTGPASSRSEAASLPTTPTHSASAIPRRLGVGAHKRRVSYAPSQTYTSKAAAEAVAAIPQVANILTPEMLNQVVAAVVAVVSSPARAMVSPMRPTAGRVSYLTNTADLLDEEALHFEPLETPTKKRRLELPQMEQPAPEHQDEIEAQPEEDDQHIHIEQHDLISAMTEEPADPSEQEADPLPLPAIGEAAKTLLSRMRNKREGWRSVERHGLRQVNRAHRRHSMTPRSLLSLTDPESH